MIKTKHLFLTVKLFTFLLCIVFIAYPADLEEIKSRVVPKLAKELQEKELSFDSQVFVRIFKKDKILEVWIKKDRTYLFFKNYLICEYSGELGPKIKKGDFQAPEGIYTVRKNHLNPDSKFHLGINIGYPNDYDKYYKRSGSAIMIHGGCISTGCYAMTDSLIEEIYILFEESLKYYDYVSVHIYPFRLTSQNILEHTNVIDTSFIGNLLSFLDEKPKYKYNEFIPLWKELKRVYDFFEDKKMLPNVQIKKGHYVITEKSN